MIAAAASAQMIHSAADRRSRRDSEFRRREMKLAIARGDDAVAEAAHRLDQLGRDLLAKAADEDLDGVGVAVEVLVVEMFDELGAGHHAVAVMKEIFEHAIFVR